MPDGKLLTVPEVMERLRLGRSTVYDLIRSRRLPSIHIVGHSALDVAMNIYAHADMTEKRAALDRLGSLLDDD
ncbi:helix-turn-helix domain-containing protein [Streptomyces jietaisiensis]|uniref:helix-turn-helix domain-containing protein n=1 Tax=Streptomyces griseoaurantiacus TaxID=68213 RepID=UPI0032542C49